MNIKLDFDIGEKIYFIDDKINFERGNKCKACLGEGRIQGKDGNNYTCPNCRGIGLSGLKENSEYVVKAGYIDYFKILVNAAAVTTKVFIDVGEYDLEERYIGEIYKIGDKEKVEKDVLKLNKQKFGDTYTGKDKI